MRASKGIDRQGASSGAGAERLAVRGIVAESAADLAFALLQATDYGILMTDPQGRDLVGNRRFGELFGVDAIVRIGDAFPRDLPPVCVEHHRLQRSAAEALRELLVGDYDRDRRIAQDVLEALGRMARVERQIGGPRLEDSEQGNDELGRARQAQTDERLVCMNLGIALEDLAVAPALVTRARALGIGTTLPL